jgi:hypothetical protein
MSRQGVAAGLRDSGTPPALSPGKFEISPVLAIIWLEGGRSVEYSSKRSMIQAVSGQLNHR